MSKKTAAEKIGLFFLAALAVGAAAVFVGPVAHPDAAILLKIRLPRVLAGLLAGASLAGAGALMQGVLRNPLADPYILGTSSGAALGAALALLAGAGYGSPLFYVLAACGAFAATAASYLLARTDNRTPAVNLLLSGVIVSAFCGALILLLFALKRDTAFSILIFMMGSITEASRAVLIGAGILFALGMGISLALSRQLDILSLGEEKARTLGVNTEALKLLAFAAGAFLCAAAVGVAGTVGFVGLIVPHVARLLLGPAHGRLSVGAVLLGAAFLTLMDAAARTIAAPAEIPVGVLTSVCGAPFFLWLLRKSKTEYKS
ncbi:MAG: iron ABC transporter permease [Elusimicrobiales bacterium]|nr:iron ABC transporter permease [Elusimicrobiales bacterium]